MGVNKSIAPQQQQKRKKMKDTIKMQQYHIIIGKNIT